MMTILAMMFFTMIVIVNVTACTIIIGRKLDDIHKDIKESTPPVEDPN